jgi:UDP-N-acetylglucosamine 2-epimerase (non-hydrolysing)
MKLAIVYGTRPEFLKLKILIDTLRSRLIPIIVIRINQHVNFNEDIGYYDKSIDIINNNNNERLCDIGNTILEKLPEMIKSCTHILSQGDTATVFYSLLCGFQMKKICIHLEAGMRTYDLENPYPEEGYRQMISRITDIHLCPSEIEKRNLIKECVKGDIYVVGNTILDLVKSYTIPIQCNNTVLITLHRRENWDSYKEYLSNLFYLARNNLNYIFYFFMHPNPSLQAILNNLNNEIPNNIHITNAVLHKDMIQMLSSCTCVITDSGGIQEEANFLGKHIYVLRKITERSAIRSNKLTLCTIDDIKNIKLIPQIYEAGLEYGDGKSVDKIIENLNIY